MFVIIILEQTWTTCFCFIEFSTCARLQTLISVSEMLTVSEQRILITSNMGAGGDKCQKSFMKSTFNFGGTFGQSVLMTFRLSKENDTEKEREKKETLFVYFNIQGVPKKRICIFFFNGPFLPYCSQNGTQCR